MGFSDVHLISRASVERGDVAILSDSSALVLATAPDPVLKRIQIVAFNRNTGAPILGGWVRDSHGDKYVEGWRVADEALLYPGVVRDFQCLWVRYKTGHNQLNGAVNWCCRVRNCLSAKDIIAYYALGFRASPGVRAAALFVTSFGESYRVPKRFRA